MDHDGRDSDSSDSWTLLEPEPEPEHASSSSTQHEEVKISVLHCDTDDDDVKICDSSDGESVEVLELEPIVAHQKQQLKDFIDTEDIPVISEESEEESDCNSVHGSHCSDFNDEPEDDRNLFELGFSDSCNYVCQQLFNEVLFPPSISMRSKHRVYRHSRNNEINSKLNLIVMLFFSIVACLALGHFIGVNKVSSSVRLADAIKKLRDENSLLHTKLSDMRIAMESLTNKTNMYTKNKLKNSVPALRSWRVTAKNKLVDNLKQLRDRIDVEADQDMDHVLKTLQVKLTVLEGVTHDRYQELCKNINMFIERNIAGPNINKLFKKLQDFHFKLDKYTCKYHKKVAVKVKINCDRVAQLNEAKNVFYSIPNRENRLNVVQWFPTNEKYSFDVILAPNSKKAKEEMKENALVIEEKGIDNLRDNVNEEDTQGIVAVNEFTNPGFSGNSGEDVGDDTVVDNILESGEDQETTDINKINLEIENQEWLKEAEKTTLKGNELEPIVVIDVVEDEFDMTEIGNAEGEWDGNQNIGKRIQRTKYEEHEKEVRELESDVLVDDVFDGKEDVEHMESQEIPLVLETLQIVGEQMPDKQTIQRTKEEIILKKNIEGKKTVKNLGKERIDREKETVKMYKSLHEKKVDFNKKFYRPKEDCSDCGKKFDSKNVRTNVHNHDHFKIGRKHKLRRQSNFDMDDVSFEEELKHKTELKNSKGAKYQGKSKSQVFRKTRMDSFEEELKARTFVDKHKAYYHMKGNMKQDARRHENRKKQFEGKVKKHEQKTKQENLQQTKTKEKFDESKCSLKENGVCYKSESGSPSNVHFKFSHTKGFYGDPRRLKKRRMLKNHGLDNNSSLVFKTTDNMKENNGSMWQFDRASGRSLERNDNGFWQFMRATGRKVGRDKALWYFRRSDARNHYRNRYSYDTLAFI